VRRQLAFVARTLRINILITLSPVRIKEMRATVRRTYRKSRAHHFQDNGLPHLFRPNSCQRRARPNKSELIRLSAKIPLNNNNRPGPLGTEELPLFIRLHGDTRPRLRAQ